MKKLSLVLTLLATPAMAASGPFFSLQNTNFVVLIAFIVFVGILIYMISQTISYMCSILLTQHSL
mgnify:CR=1 FL=1